MSSVSEMLFLGLLPTGVFVLGACVGSFLNVVILRNPLGRSVVRPGSRCDACGAPLWARDNLPLVGWLFRLGRARCCGARISLRYPFVELLTALLFLASWLSFPSAKGVVGLLFLSLLIVASFIDLDHGVIPDWLTLGGAVLGLLFSLLVPELHVTAEGGSGFSLSDHMRSFLGGAQGLLIGSGVLLWIALVAEAFLKKEAMGFGDVKFVGMVGAFCGWEGAVFSIFVGASLGTLALAALRIFKRRASPLSQTVPFGPMLAPAAALYFLWAGPRVERVLADFAEALSL